MLLARRIQPDQLAAHWTMDGANDRNIVYGYDNTVQTDKTTREGLTVSAGTLVEDVGYTYNLQGRISSIDDGTTTTTYEYDDSGIRVAQTVGGATTRFVNDANNLTGFSQVLEEFIVGPANLQLVKSYAIALDVVSQFNGGASPQTMFFLADVHGSTRALLNDVGAIIEGHVLDYAAYGELLTHTTEQAAQLLTTLQFSGEQVDARTGLSYLRGRYYDLSTGRFKRLDPFAGDSAVPLTLNKYGYVHGNPIINVDPSGEFSLSELLASTAVQTTLRVASRAVAAYNIYGTIRDAFDTYEVFAKVLNGEALTTEDYLTVAFTASNFFNPLGSFGRGGVFASVAGRTFGVAGRAFKGITPILAVLTRSAKGTLRKQARRILKSAGVNLADKAVHHRLPLEYSHLFGRAEPNRLSNLIGLDDEIHKQVNNVWNAFRRANPNPRPAEVLKQAIEIDKMFSWAYTIPR